MTCPRSSHYLGAIAIIAGVLLFIASFNSSRAPDKSASSFNSFRAPDKSAPARWLDEELQTDRSHVLLSYEDKVRRLGAPVTQFGNCMPYCNRSALKLLISGFVEAYKNKPFSDNACGCLVNHAFANFAVARLSPSNMIVENGVNAGMSGYLFRAAKPQATIWHIDPLSKPICDPDKRVRWKDTGPSVYYVGPSASPYYTQMANQFARTDGDDAAEVAKEYNSHGFADFFEVDWAGLNRDDMLIFFDTHQRDFDNTLKARALGFKLFLYDDNYNAHDPGDMDGHSMKQVLHRGGPQGKNLVSVLDFYYEMPPLIQPAAIPAHILAKYPTLVVGEAAEVFKIDRSDYKQSFDQKALLDLEDPQDLKLFELLLTVALPSEFVWYNHMAVAGVY